jgi:hypothetical protein
VVKKKKDNPNANFARMGGYVDLTLGPHWPTGFPRYTPDSPETMKELVHGQAFIEAGQSYNGSLPLPKAAPSGNSTVNNVNATLKLVAVLTARTSTTNVSASVVEINNDSIALVTDRVSDDNKITWNAPNDGSYIRRCVRPRNWLDSEHVRQRVVT